VFRLLLQFTPESSKQIAALAGTGAPPIPEKR
jgi:hypothetical protein